VKRPVAASLKNSEASNGAVLGLDAVEGLFGAILASCEFKHSVLHSRAPPAIRTNASNATSANLCGWLGLAARVCQR
jgi:hypothetical protein